MGSSLKLFSVRGIDVRLHFTFPLILIWAALQFGFIAGTISGALFGLIVVTFLFALVTLHELGHSIVAQHFDVTVERIVLSPIGGVAQLKRMPEQPIQELLIAIGGPAVNLVIAFVMGASAVLLGINLFNLSALNLAGITLTFEALFTYIFFYNILLAAFNLLPAFPMDGGRILRALLAMRISFGRATTIAGSIGRGIAILLGLYGLIDGGIFLVVVALFIFTAAGQEMSQARIRERMTGYRVRDVYSTSAICLNPNNVLQEAVNLTLTSGQTGIPVCQGEILVGFLPQAKFRSALHAQGPSTPINAVMRRDITPVSSDTDLYQVHQRMLVERIDSLPVVDNHRYIGLISREQISRLYKMLNDAPWAVQPSQSS